jgi:hypothetical protein
MDGWSTRYSSAAVADLKRNKGIPRLGTYTVNHRILYAFCHYYMYYSSIEYTYIQRPYPDFVQVQIMSPRRNQFFLQPIDRGALHSTACFLTVVALISS